jgi:two-component system response regulator YesN
MRVLIADDEYLARSSLRSMLEDLDLSLELVGEATNGEEMVKLVRRLSPEVVFVDIRMPQLNGLEAIRIGRTASPQTKWFILTGFPEFNYAQEATRLGVSDYLLKPVDPEELRRVLLDFIQENKKAVAARNKQFERDIIALYHGLSSPAHEGGDSFILRSHFIGAIFYIDSHLAENTKAERQLDFCRKIQGTIDRISDNKIRIALFVLPGGELATVGAWEPIPGLQLKQCIQVYFRGVEQATCRSSDHDFAVTVLLSEECSSYQELQDQLDRLQKLAPLRAVCGIGGKLQLPKLTQLASQPGWLEFANLITETCRYYNEKTYLNYVKTLQNCARFIRDMALADNSILKKALADFICCSTQCRVVPNQSLKTLIQLLEEYGEQILVENPREDSQSTDTISQVISFVDQHYMHDIGIGQIAEQLHITPNYLSTLFHKKTGTAFRVYLTRTRMLRAKELLADPNMQIQQVAEQVGYSSARYFTKVFTKFVGCYPSEYRSKFKPPGVAKEPVSFR